MIGEAEVDVSGTSQPDARADAREQFGAVASLEALHAMLRRCGITPGWAKVEPSLYPEPKQNYRPVHWRWSMAISGVMPGARSTSALPP